MNPLAQTHTALANPDLKRDYNRHLFKEVAPRYDLITRVLSFGRDAFWKKWMLRQLPSEGVNGVLDLACGTGDITRALASRYPTAKVTGLDLTPKMLELARELAPADLRFVEGDMMNTGWEAGSCDIITGGYALRNAPDLDAALSEVHRLLRPGGQAAFLDFSASANPIVRKFHYLLLWSWGALWGLLLHGDPRVYAYIARSLAHFPDRESLHVQFTAHNLPLLKTKRFMFGLIEVVICEKGAVE
jgi:demethylmenaquinone methyltransferase/2-methoxy-6-polyprenyl-1,4-benzoquinol methylase